MNLSEHFTLEEMSDSVYAKLHGLDNTPPPEAVEELRKLCIEILEPIRALNGKPIDIDVAYRSAEVNRGVGGVPTSQHQIGQAADFVVVGVSHKSLMNQIIASSIPFDQLIYEHGEGGWIHVSRRDLPRRQALQSPDGKHYTTFVPQGTGVS